MQFTNQDKRAAREGFKFVVFSFRGERKCYCTTRGEAVREAGKLGKFVSLSRLSYVANPQKRNPSKHNPDWVTWGERLGRGAVKVGRGAVKASRAAVAVGRGAYSGYKAERRRK